MDHTIQHINFKKIGDSQNCENHDLNAVQNIYNYRNHKDISLNSCNEEPSYFDIIFVANELNVLLI